MNEEKTAKDEPLFHTHKTVSVEEIMAAGVQLAAGGHAGHGAGRAVVESGGALSTVLEAHRFVRPVALESLYAAVSSIESLQRTEQALDVKKP